jgi:hypothetical protein
MKKVEVIVTYYCTEEQFEDGLFQEFLEKVSDGSFEFDIKEESGLSFENVTVELNVS